MLPPFFLFSFISAGRSPSRTVRRAHAAEYSRGATAVALFDCGIRRAGVVHIHFVVVAIVTRVSCANAMHIHSPFAIIVVVVIVTVVVGMETKVLRTNTYTNICCCCCY